MGTLVVPQEAQEEMAETWEVVHWVAVAEQVESLAQVEVRALEAPQSGWQKTLSFLLRRPSLFAEQWMRAADLLFLL